MIFRNTEVAGVRIVELEPHTDERGFFARSFCTDEFGAAGIAMTVVQANISRNSRRGTLRGLHY
ncbi:MAG: dTDP-4-dehydrorhamnose 3,5-epimerase family protein, partial [Alphaproteobacteria bacterium]